MRPERERGRMWLGKHLRKLVRMMREGMKEGKYKRERENMVGKLRVTAQCKEREKEGVNMNARQSKKARERVQHIIAKREH